MTTESTGAEEKRMDDDSVKIDRGPIDEIQFLDDDLKEKFIGKEYYPGVPTSIQLSRDIKAFTSSLEDFTCVMRTERVMDRIESPSVNEVKKAVELLFHWQRNTDGTNMASQLFTLFQKADGENLVRFSKGFPALFQAWEMWREAPNPTLFFASFGLHMEEGL